MNRRTKALNFAAKAHDGQKRNNGDNYITHPIRVAKIALTYNLSKIELENYDYESHTYIHDYSVEDLVYCAAVLHDTIEDCDVDYSDILRETTEEVADAVMLLSRGENQTYFDFIHDNLVYYGHESPSVAQQIAVIVKLADLEDNMSDLKEGSLKDKYRFAREVLLRVGS